jgi:HD superfamily phosphohydrolase YqeK
MINEELVGLTNKIRRISLSGVKNAVYYRLHVGVMIEYMHVIASKLNLVLPGSTINIICRSHDILKFATVPEESKRPSHWNNIEIPWDINRYVRMNLDVLEEYMLDEYFNTDVQLHPLAAGIFLHKELGFTKPDILYPVMFHSCPILNVYRELPPHIQRNIDIVVLADKLSSNYLKINYLKTEVRVDLDKLVFGEEGNEFNYTFGLFVARLIGQGNSRRKHTMEMTDHYHKRLMGINPLIPKKYSLRRLGGSMVCPERKSRVLMNLSNILNQ